VKRAGRPRRPTGRALSRARRSKSTAPSRARRASAAARRKGPRAAPGSAARRERTGVRRGRVSASREKVAAARRPTGPGQKASAGAADLLFEIGVEELPASYVAPALDRMRFLASKDLEELRLSCNGVETFATPRRLALFVRSLAERQRDTEEEVQGPATRVAYDAQGNPTQALLGFCRSKGVDPSSVRRVETPRGEYTAATLRQVGKPALGVLPAMLAKLATRLPFPKAMRWIAGDETRFARPVRWLLALLGDRVVQVREFGLEAGRRSRGHRFLHGKPVEIRRAADYLAALERASVLADHRARLERIAGQVEGEARRAGGQVVPDPELLEIDNFLVEWPTAFAGHFDSRYLELPRDVIVTALREHQRFFAVEDPAGRLMPVFVAVRNGDERGLDRVRKGNEDVLAARLEDACFYWETDLKHPPAQRVEHLGGVVWMEGLGTLRDKAARLEALSGWLAERLAPAAAAAARRAALLCKTDLLSEMIGSGKEYASLEGVMGGHYARRSGEPEAVASAIAEHYRPRGVTDALPATEAGTILSIADKLDHVSGAFVAGKIPSGSEDPYGVRRSGNGVVRILVELQRHLSLGDASMEATRPLFGVDADLPQAKIMGQLKEFWSDRVWSFVGGGQGGGGEAFDPWVVEAAMGARMNGQPGWADPYDCRIRSRALDGFKGDSRFESLVILYRRVDNILKAAKEPLPSEVDRSRVSDAAEQELLGALERARERTQPLWEKRDYWTILPALLDLEQVIHGFFDRVLVNVDDAPIRLNRLRLLAEVRELFARGWDLSKAVVEGERG